MFYFANRLSDNLIIMFFNPRGSSVNESKCLRNGKQQHVEQQWHGTNGLSIKVRCIEWQDMKMKMNMKEFCGLRKKSNNLML